MRSSIEITIRFLPIGGIVGIVCAISEKDDTIVLETGSDRTKIRFRRTAIFQRGEAGHGQQGHHPC